MKIGNRARTAARIVMSICTVFHCAASAFGQAVRGSISGLVTDQTGAIIPGATVKAVNDATGVARSTVTSDGGLYTFVSLNP